MDKKIEISRLLRQNQTKAEKKLWGYLRNRKFQNLKFRRQHPLKEYIVDFFCVEFGIVIELDGEYHNQINQKEKDELRDVHLKELGYHVLRFENKLVFESIDIIFQSILNAKKSQIPYSEERKENLSKRKELHKQQLSPALSTKRGGNTILSTKKLSLAQKELLLNAKVNFVAYDAVKIEFIDFTVVTDADNYIFTSQNAVHAFLEKESVIKPTFCVGDKTKALLIANGFNVLETADSAKDLAKTIVAHYKNTSFIHFTGNLRRPELPNYLKKYNVKYNEVVVYHSTFQEKEFKQNFDGVLFFSPSAVQSYTALNKLDNAMAFCIGETTSEEAKKHTVNCIIANKPSIENVIVQAIKYNKLKQEY